MLWGRSGGIEKKPEVMSLDMTSGRGRNSPRTRNDRGDRLRFQAARRRDDQYWSAESTSPPASETRPRKVTMLTESFRKRTLPSPIRMLTPPGWKDASSSFLPALLPWATKGPVVNQEVTSWSGRYLLFGAPETPKPSSAAAHRQYRRNVASPPAAPGPLGLFAARAAVVVA